MIKTKEWLIESRQKAGLTQQQLADRSGISVAAIRNIEQGNRDGSYETWNTLITTLENKIYTLVEVIEELKGYKIQYQTPCGIVSGLEYDDFSGFESVFSYITISKREKNLEFYDALNKDLRFIKKTNVDYIHFSSFNNEFLVSFCDGEGRSADTRKRLNIQNEVM